MSRPKWRRGVLWLPMATLMGGSGMLHLVKPEPYRRIVPPWLGHAEFLVLSSGIAEIAAAALLLHPGTRRWGGFLTAAVLVVVFPANVQMALDGPDGSGGFFTGSALLLWLRLPVQPLLIWWALSIAAPRPRSAII